MSNENANVGFSLLSEEGRPSSIADRDFRSTCSYSLDVRSSFKKSLFFVSMACSIAASMAVNDLREAEEVRIERARLKRDIVTVTR